MPFRFRLDAVLRFREGVERTEEAALHRIVSEIAEVELELQEVNLQQTQLRERRECDLRQKLPAFASQATGHLSKRASGPPGSH